ncbi:MAG: glycosyltransferase [Candidatus Eisenbacteria sp.]|nr:glycosyltransferase [Candidatus Eisenbacteria bacterium]
MSRNSRSKRPRVLVLDEEIPLPPNTGKRIRTLNLLSRLSRDFEIDLLVHANGVTKSKVVELAERGLQVEVAPSRIPAKAGIAFLMRLAGNLPSRWPYSVDSHYQAQYQRRLGELLSGRHYDLIHVEWTPYARYVLSMDLPWVVSAHNVESQIWARMSDRDSFPPRRLFIRSQARKMYQFERQVFARARWATAVSHEDAATLQRSGCPRVHVVPNGVDTDYFRNDGSWPEDRHTLVFTASMDYRPNQDAIMHFLNDIFPHLATHGDYRLLAVGRNPPAGLGKAVKRCPQITLTGTVDDVRPYIARGGVFVVPLRIGSGSRLKILEALSMRRAVVSTTVGAEGLEVEHGKDIILADEPEGFARAVAELAEDASRREAMGTAGRELVEKRYSWDEIARLQGELWQDAIEATRR